MNTKWILVLLLAVVGALSAVAWYSPQKTDTPSDTATTTERGVAPYNSGVKGTVLAGPTCPVERDPPDPKCADKPLKIIIAIYRESDRANPVVFTNSITDGSYETTLPPGAYIVAAGESVLPRCSPTTVVVKANEYTVANISCDTGIR